MHKNEVGIRELKTHLSAFLRRVRSGETITVTEHGTPIGQIVPVPESTISKISTLENAGVVSWSGKPLRPREPVGDTEGDRLISDLLLENRR